MGSSSKNPSLSNSSDSLNGLKFGQKIYFEDVGIVSPGKSGGGSSSDGGGGKHQVSVSKQTPRCQVEGCKVDLSDAKAYYGRHKVCGVHSKTPKVVVNGIDQRFCQQCSRFHQLSEFDQGKRSCRRRLAGHNERRRKPSPGSLFSPPYGRLSSSVFETGQGGGFLMDFSTYPKQSMTETWPPTIIRPQTHNHQHSASMGSQMAHSTITNNPSFPQGSSSSGTCYNPMGPTVPSSGEYLTGGAHLNNSVCALSLLSNETRMVPHDVPFEGAQMAHMAHSTIATHSANHFNGTPWDGTVLHETPHHLGLSQVALPDNQYPVGPAQHNMQYVDHAHSRAFDSSTQFTNWSL